MSARLRHAVIAAALLIGFGGAAGGAQERKGIPPQDRGNPLRELIPGRAFSPVDVRALEDDDFDNPGFGWVAKGEARWRTVEGAAGKSCGGCHGPSSDAMRGKAAGFPKFDPPENKVVTLEQRINLCRRDKMGAAPWAYASEDMLGMITFLRIQSRGLPVEVRIDGPAKAAFEAGQALYGRKRGQLGMSCAQCHNDNYGKTYGDRTISQGHGNGFPTFHVEDRSFRSLHQQFAECDQRARAEPLAAGADDYVALELYLSWRGAGLPVQAPSVRR